MAVAQTPEPAAPAEQAPANPLTGMVLMIAVFLAIMYFLMIRPQQRRERERRQMLSALTKGDRVVTTGGICGTIVGLSDKSVVLRVDEDSNVKIEFLRSAISHVSSRGGQE
jgi:preprotein translocase subunit YajC